MRNAFHGLISRLDKAEERISALKGMSTEISKIEKQKRLGVKKKKRNRISNWDKYNRCNIHTQGMPEGEERQKRTDGISEATMTENSPD